MRADTLLLVGRVGSGGAEFLGSEEEESHEKSPEIVILRFPGLRGLGGVGSVFVESVFSTSPLPASGDERPCRAASLAKELSEPRLSFENLEASFEDRFVLGEAAGDGKGLVPAPCWSNVLDAGVAAAVSETLSSAVARECECDCAS